MVYATIGPVSDEEAAACRSIELQKSHSPGFVPGAGLAPIIEDIHVDEDPDELKDEPEPEHPLVPGRPPIEPFADSGADGIEPPEPRKKRARPQPARV